MDLGEPSVWLALMLLVYPQALVRGGGTTDTTEKGNRGLVQPAWEAAPTGYRGPSGYAVQPPAPALQGQLPHLPPQQPAALRAPGPW